VLGQVTWHLLGWWLALIDESLVDKSSKDCAPKWSNHRDPPIIVPVRPDFRSITSKKAAQLLGANSNRKGLQGLREKTRRKVSSHIHRVACV
jgi:hypothetical protein